MTRPASTPTSRCRPAPTGLSGRCNRLRAQEAAARLLWPVGDTRLVRRLHRVTQPALLVFGKDDRVLPASYRQRFQRALPHARLEVVDGAGHLVDLDAPQTLARLVEEFLRS